MKETFTVDDDPDVPWWGVTLRELKLCFLKNNKLVHGQDLNQKPIAEFSPYWDTDKQQQ